MAQSHPTTLQLDLPAISDRHHSRRGLLLKLALTMLLVGAVAMLWYGWLQPHEALLEQSLARLGPWAPVLFVCVFAITTTCFVPESLLAIAAGSIFGLWWGLLWVVIAGVLTASCMLVLARGPLRHRITLALAQHPKVRAIDEVATDQGLRLALLLRLAPVSFALLNLLLAISALPRRAFLISCLGMVPGNFATVYMGWVARHTADLAVRVKSHDGLPPADSIVHEAAVYMGLAAAVCCSLLVGRVAMQSIRKPSSEPA